MNSFDLAAPLIKHYEALRLTAYLCPAGVWTIGYGHTGQVVRGQTCTEAGAEAMLRADMQAVLQAIRKQYGTILGWKQEAALVSFCFNTGAGILRTSTLGRRIKAGDYAAAGEEFGRWVWAKNPRTGLKQKLPGLVRRRAQERALWDAAR